MRLAWHCWEKKQGQPLLLTLPGDETSLTPSPEALRSATRQPFSTLPINLVTGRSFSANPTEQRSTAY